MQPVSLRPLTADDFGLLTHGLKRPHLRLFSLGAWDEAAIAAKFTPRLAAHHPMRCFIAEESGMPFGYVQSYRNAAYSAHALIAGSAGITVDYFIGDVARLKLGLAAALLREFVNAIMPAHYPGEERVSLYHDSGNHEVIRCSQSVGFKNRGSFMKAGRRQYLMEYLR